LILFVKRIAILKRVKNYWRFGNLVTDVLSDEYLGKAAIPGVGIAEKLETLETVTVLQLESHALLEIVPHLRFLLLVQNPSLRVELEVFLTG
jgi:hypothetical protein